MRTRIEGLVQLTTGDAVKGVISRAPLFWKFLRVDNATGLAAADPGHPSKMDGTVWIPKSKVAFIQEITQVEVA